jgi:chitodextrinase
VKTYCFIGFKIASTILGLGLSTSPASDTARILPLGDSITEGIQTNSYRPFLYQSLEQHGLRVDFQGSRFGANKGVPNVGLNFDLDHEAPSGIRIDQVFTSLPTALSNSEANQVLLHLGTNDLLAGDSAANAVTEMRQLIDLLRADRPSVAIFLAQIFPHESAATNALINEFNVGLASLAEELNRPASPVILVDMNSGFSHPSDFIDAIHPNDAANAIIADRWETALLAYDAFLPPTTPTALFGHAFDDSSVALTWNASNDNLGIAGYEIGREGTVVTTTSDCFFTETGLAAETSYTYQITAFDAAGNTSPVSEVTVKTLPSGQTSAPSQLRVNIGGASYTDSSGQLWLAERGVSGGITSMTTDPIAGTVDDPLFQTDRFGEYTITDSVPAGDYFLILHFAEFFNEVDEPGKRLFDIVLSQSGSTFANIVNYDILRSVSSNEATSLIVPVSLISSPFTIQFLGNTQNGKLGAYELYPVSNLPDQLPPTKPQSLSAGSSGNGVSLSWNASSDNNGVSFYEIYRNQNLLGTTAAVSFLDDEPLAGGQYLYEIIAVDAAGNRSAAAETLYNETGTGGMAIRINAGGSSYMDSNGFEWEADFGFVGSGGNAGLVTTAPIANTIDDPLFQTERFAPNLRYAIPVPLGQYLVRIHFAEVFSGAFGNGLRVFDINVEGQNLRTAYDIFSESGAETATSLFVELPVIDGILNIDCVRRVENPKISAIEILPVSSGGGGTTPATPELLIQHAPTAESVYLSWDNGSNGLDADTFEISRDGILLDMIEGFEFFDFETSPSMIHTYEIVAVVGEERSTPAVTEVATPAKALDSILRINAGGEEYVDSLGQTWQADFGSNGGVASFVTSNPIANTTDDFLYQSERFKTNLAYTLALPNRDYIVRLHFAEIFSGITSPGQRVFDVFLEGNQVFNDLDIFAEIGSYAAISYDIPIELLDGELNLNFAKVVENPKLSAIEILVPDDAVLRINSGGFSPYFSSDAKIWQADFGFNSGGNAGVVTNAPIANTDDPFLFQTERFNPALHYDIPLASGDYTIRLLLAEVFDGAYTTGARVFDVFEEGDLALQSVDIFDLAGAETAVTLEFPTTVTDDVLNIQFGQISQNPKVNGFEILRIEETTTNSPVIEFIFVSSPNTVTLSWQAVPSAVTYRVLRDGVELATTAATSYSDDTVEAESEYLYEIIAIDGGGNESPAESVTFTVPDLASQEAIRINTGGGDYIDANGLVWEADFGFSGSGGGAGTVTTAAIANTDDDVLYQSERFSSNLRYAIPVPNGNYEVNLHLAEVYFGTFGSGTRVFGATAEGETVVSSINLLQEVGPNAAHVESAVVEVNDGTLNIIFNTIQQKPKVSAIEIIPTSVVNSIAAPTLLLGKAPDPSGAILQWAQPGPVPAAEYEISRDGTVIATTTTTELIDIGLSSDSDYLYEIIAIDSELNASPPLTVQIRTPLVEYESVLRINSGGEVYTDRMNRIWSADTGFLNGKAAVVTSNAIDNTEDDVLYHSERFGSNLAYALPVEDGTYKLQLHFAEVYFGVYGPGTRIFDIEIEGATVATDFNIVESVGSDAALVYCAPVTVSDGTLNINFPNVVEKPKLSAIELLAPTKSVVRVNSGGAAYFDGQGRIWRTDNGFTSGNGGEVTSAVIANTEDDPLYQSERFGPNVNYNFTLPSGLYEVDLHFAEVFPGAYASGSRVFDVLAEGSGVIFGLDIFDSAGSETAYIETIPLSVADGELSLSLAAQIQNAKILAIEVRSQD